MPVPDGFTAWLGELPGWAAVMFVSCDHTVNAVSQGRKLSAKDRANRGRAQEVVEELVAQLGR